MKWLRDISVLLLFPPNRTNPSFVHTAMGSFWFPLMTTWQIWRCGKSAPMRIEISLSITSVGTSLRCDHFRCISAFDIRCDGTTHVFLTSIWSGWCAEQIENSKKFDVTETDVDIALVMFSFRCFPFSFRVFANSDVIKVVSEPKFLAGPLPLLWLHRISL